MKDKDKILRISIRVSVVVWVIGGLMLLVPMNEGGAAAVACLFMLLVFSAIMALDIRGTKSLMKPKLGCLSILYFVVWAIVLFYASILTIIAPFMLQGEAAAIPWWGKLLFGLIYGIAAAFAFFKIMVGRMLRRNDSQEQTIQQSAAPLPPAPAGPSEGER